MSGFDPIQTFAKLDFRPKLPVARPDATTGAQATPIFQTTSYVLDDVDHAAPLFNLQSFG